MRVKDRVVICRDGDLFKFYHIDLMRDQAQSRATTTDINSTSRTDPIPWIEHRVSPGCVALDCDVSQDLLVYYEDHTG